MKAFTNSVGNVTFVLIDTLDAKKALAHADTEGHNQISVPVFIRTGAGPKNLHSMAAIAAAMGKEKAFVCSGDIATRKYEPKTPNGSKVED